MRTATCQFRINRATGLEKAVRVLRMMKLAYGAKSDWYNEWMKACRKMERLAGETMSKIDAVDASLVSNIYEAIKASR